MAQSRVTLIGGRVFDRHEVERVLLDAAMSAGPTKAVAMTTNRSGLDAGEAKPRTAPERPNEEQRQDRGEDKPRKAIFNS